MTPEILRNIEQEHGDIRFNAQRKLIMRHEAVPRTIIDNGIFRYTPDGASDQGAIFFDEITVTGDTIPDALAAFDFCMGGGNAETIDLTAKNLIFQAARHLLPPGQPVETVTIDNVALAVSKEQECLGIEAFEANHILHRTRQGARLEIARVSFAMQEIQGRPASLSIEGELLRDETGLPLFALDALQIIAQDAMPVIDALSPLTGNLRQLTARDLYAVLLTRPAKIDFTMTGLSVYPGRILDDDMAGLFPHDRHDAVSGNLSMSRRHAEGRITLAMAMNLTRVAETEFAATLIMPADEGASWADMRLVNLSLAFSDHGLLHLLPVSPERSLATVMAQHLPGRAQRLAAPVLAALENEPVSMDFSLEPEDPISFPEIGLMMITNPDALHEFMGFRIKNDFLER